MKTKFFSQKIVSNITPLNQIPQVPFFPELLVDMKKVYFPKLTDKL